MRKLEMFYKKTAEFYCVLLDFLLAETVKIW